MSSEKIKQLEDLCLEFIQILNSLFEISKEMNLDHDQVSQFLGSFDEVDNKFINSILMAGMSDVADQVISNVNSKRGDVVEDVCKKMNMALSNNDFSILNKRVKALFLLLSTLVKDFQMKSKPYSMILKAVINGSSDDILVKKTKKSLTSLVSFYKRHNEILINIKNILLDIGINQKLIEEQDYFLEANMAFLLTL